MADIRNRNLTLADCRFDWVFHGYDSAFQGQATFSDIDGVVHHKGHFLFIEHKSMSREDKLPSLPKGQLGLYSALAALPNSTCWLVCGDMQKSVPYYIEEIGGSEFRIDLRGEDDMTARSVLKHILDSWFEYANSNQPKAEK
jgi:hypothetical protein